MLLKAAKVEVCPEREKLVLLLLDEMHIREDIVNNKHSGEMIGFANLGEINEHLIAFEKSICSHSDKPTPPSPARTMMVFMVRGLFSSLQFPYAQFPCAELTGELLYDPFWEAVKRIENVGLKVHVCTIHVFLFVNHVDIHVIMYYNASWHLHICVECDLPFQVQVMGATLDGNAVNRRLIKLHDPTEVVYKTRNPFADDGRDFFFFSGPPHLTKTIRNCYYSKHRKLWVC